MSKNNKIKYTVAFILVFIISIYLFVPIIATSSGHVEDIVNAYGTQSFAGNLKLLIANKMVFFKWFKCFIVFFGFVAGLIFVAGHVSHKKEDGPIAIPEQGTYGTAEWMPYERAREIFTVKSGTSGSGIIFGKLEKGGSIELRRSGKFETVALSLPVTANKNVAVYGAAGTGKSRAFVRNQIMQIARMGQSMVITDPKAEIFEDMAPFLRDHEGYNVKVLNLVHMIHSDRWNPLAEVTDDISAQSFAETVMANTRPVDGKVDEFWEKSEMNLLKALVLYVVTVVPEGNRNLATVYSMLVTKNVVILDAMFAQLDSTNPAKMPYAIYSQASDKIKPNIVIGLGSKLQIFQNEIVQNLTATSDIDLTAPKYEKTAYFCITSDSESTFDFVASLFFSFLFMKLTKYADFYKKMIPIEEQQEVYFILDEFPNIGAIPGFKKKISTLRSRGIICFIIFQNIAQLKNRYPHDAWFEILGNCDSQLFLGASDDMTAKQVSEHIGPTTVESHSSNKKAGIEGIADFGSQNVSPSGRNLQNPDELLRLDRKKAILMYRGEQPLMLYKMDYSEHEMAKHLKPTGIRDYKLPWAEKYYLDEEKMIERAMQEVRKRKKKPMKEFSRLRISEKEILIFISKILKIVEEKINSAVGNDESKVVPKGLQNNLQEDRKAVAQDFVEQGKEEKTDIVSSESKNEEISMIEEKNNNKNNEGEKLQVENKFDEVKRYDELSREEIENEIHRLEKLRDKKPMEKSAQLNFFKDCENFKEDGFLQDEHDTQEDEESFW
ncbi:VirD4-like conjugal transfer protein, CD1115 family [Clostridium sp. MT-14]|uniref:VirD4-like conjugal transfer protein, CD1115 family n=1 Tax=Clostridium sp. MT-14 TaxID=3348360 RepID=UPI0035F295BD